MSTEQTVIPKKYVNEVCKIGKGNDSCRYLVSGHYGFECAKHTMIAPQLDRRVKEKTLTARGDNCKGWSKIDKSMWIVK